MNNSNSRPDLSWDQKQRIRFVEALAIWRGRVTISDLRDAFDIPTGRAEKDLKLYGELAPNNLQRQRATGEYVPSDQFVPQYLRGTSSEYQQILRHHDLDNELPMATVDGRALAIESLELPAREFDVRVLARLSTAIRDRRWLRIEYQSMTHPEPRDLRISPHALAFVGRWHARAWSEKHEGFRDFLLSRICGLPKLEEKSPHQSEEDWDWCNHIPVRIAPHPGLSDAQKRVVEQDYGMLHGMQETRVRVSLAPYFMKLLGVGQGDLERPAQEQQIVLMNAADIEALNRLR